MNNNNNITSNTIITTNTTTKRSSLSSRASKIPQKLAQSSFFSLRPSASTLINNNNNNEERGGTELVQVPSSSPPPPYNDSTRLTARIGQMLFSRQRTTSESVIKESRSFSTTTTQDYNSRSVGRSDSQSRSLDIKKANNANSYPTRRDHFISIKSTFNNMNSSDKSNSSSTSPYYSISSPERTDFYSYYYNDTTNTTTTAGSVVAAPSTTPKYEIPQNPLFSPLSFTNSSVSSFTDSILVNSATPPQSPMIPIISSNSFATTTAETNDKSIDEFATMLIDRCAWYLDLSDDMTFSHVREIETIMDQAQLLLDSVVSFPPATTISTCENISGRGEDEEEEYKDLSIELKQCKEVIHNIYQSSMDLKDHEVSIKSMIRDTQEICQKCIKFALNSPLLSNCTTDLFKKETTKIMSNLPTAQDYKSMKSDQIDENANWFRHHFVGKPYHTFIGSLQSSHVTKLPLIDVDKNSKVMKNKATSSNIPKRRNSKSMLSSFLSSSPTSQQKELYQKPQQQQQQQTLAEQTASNIGIISVVQERAKDFGGPGNGAAGILGSQYRIIVRSRELEQSRYIIHECMARETQSQLESRGESQKMDKVVTSDYYYKRLRPFNSSNMNSVSSSYSNKSSSNGSSAANSIISQSYATTVTSDNQNTFTSRMIRAAILSACPNIDLRSFKELSAESTIMAGLEKDLLKYDEIHIPKHYKFGLLTIKNHQTTEEAWFANTGLSKDLLDFLNIMGKKIKLKGYQGYAAGLDTKSEESGEFAYVSKWNDFDIMFHVAPLMPSHANDKQQVLRKKHIGNDIVCIIFLEGDQVFNPKAIRSQFLHVYIIIRSEINSHTEKRHWRVEVLSNKNVNKFGPSLPSPPIFNDDETLKEFLTLKLINAENAALKSDKFCIPNNKARLGLLSSHIETGLSFSSPQVVRSSSTNRLLSSSSNNKHHKSAPLKKSNGVEEEGEEEESFSGFLKRRPKSVNSNKSTHSRLQQQQLQQQQQQQQQQQAGGSRLLREAILDEEKRRVVGGMASTDIPPMPTISRSTLLQDFKKGLSRIKSTTSSSGRPSNNSQDPQQQPQQQKNKVIRKSSQLKISSIPENVTIVTSGRPANSSTIIDEEEMFVGKDINISSESFISTEELFSVTGVSDDEEAEDNNNTTTTTEEDHRLSSPRNILSTPPTSPSKLRIAAATSSPTTAKVKSGNWI